MTIKRGTSFTGVSSGELQPRMPITYLHLDTTAADQGYAFEKLTHLDAADGTTSPPPSNTGHNHSETGNLIYRPFMTQSWGLENGMNLFQNGTDNIDQGPYTIFPTSASTVTTDARAFCVMFFVPASFVDRDIIFGVNVEGEPLVLATLYNSSFSVVSGYQSIPLQDIAMASSMVAEADYGLGATYGLRFSVSSAGLYVFDCRTGFDADTAPRKFKGCFVVPEISISNRSSFGYDTPDALSSNNIQVGDPDNSNAWHPVDSELTNEERPLDCGLMIVANNSAFIYERATGNVLPGNATITAGGHNHSGTSGYGREFEYPMGGWSFGGKWDSALTEVFGNGSRAPAPNTSGTWQEIFRTKIYTPTAASSGNLKCWILLEHDSSKGSTVEVRVNLGGTTQTFSSTGTASTHLLNLIGGTAFSSHSSGSGESFTIEVRRTVAGTASAYVLACALAVDV